jgi:enterobactin synthetase component D
LPALVPREPLLALGPGVKSAGFAVDDPEAVLAALSEWVVEGMPQKAVAKRRAEFLAGRFAARQALAALGVDATPSRLEDGRPAWPEDVVGSITHGATRALCVVARSSEVRSLGIDAERLMEESASVELRERICRASERALLAEALGVPEHHAVTFGFSAKESLYKCLYPLMGRFMEFHAARVIAAAATSAAPNELRAELELELAVDWSDELRAGRRFRAQLVSSASHVETAVLLGA